ncbi:MAG: hypothetical protein ACHQC8_03135 [Solirubrobacterales bacterium]
MIRPRGVLAAEGNLGRGPEGVAATQSSIYYAPRPARAAQVGMNIDPTIPKLEALKAAGVDYVRMGPSWPAVEDFTTGQLTLPKGATAAFEFMAVNGMHPVCVAAYGPPNFKVAQLTIAANVPVGSLTIPLTAPPPNLKIPCDFVSLAHTKGHKAQFITNPFYAYYGSIVAGSEGNSIKLGAKTSVALTAGQELNLRRLRYQPIPDLNPNGKSVRAYMRYARFVAEQVVSHGCTGYVCLWNEYPWTMDKWPSLYGFYEETTRPVSLVRDKGMAAILLAALKEPHLPAGVNWINGASDKTGYNSILNQFENAPGVLTAASVNGWREGMHPYNGRGPEAGAGWDDELKLANRTLDLSTNFIVMARWDRASGFDIRPIATECGATWEDPVEQARQDLRRVASMWGMGIVPFLGLEQAPTGSLSYLALQRLTSLRDSLGPGGDRSKCPRVASVTGNAWPIMSIALFGEHGAMLLIWQRTWALLPKDEPGGGWANVPSPPPATVTLALGSAGHITGIQNVCSGESLPSELTVPVADDPIAVLVTA